MLTFNDEEIFLPISRNNLIFNLNSDKNKILQILDLTLLYIIKRVSL